MGAETFMTQANGKSAQDAFNAAVEDANYEHGHGGYTGTIAEKCNFTTIPSTEENSYDYAEKLIDEGDERIDDKWGPAGCIELGSDRYLFFGWASS
ncbi:MAG: hypothetical protein HRT89_21215 [Lentisphaeria bacterium]|nr:hypothetical protein [Lentisphaeria bacterium]NQZ70581.1 hypothetical protein [Lentisphaeria bacterium]